MPNTIRNNRNETQNDESDIRSIREINGEIEDGSCDVLVFNDVSCLIIFNKIKFNHLIDFFNLITNKGCLLSTHQHRSKEYN